jgi:hypothetical protein
MYGPDGMRLFLAAAPAAIIAALLAAASTNGNTSPTAKALAPTSRGTCPAPWPHVSPAQAPRVRAGERETVLGRCSHPAGNPPGHQFDARGQRSATPRMAGCFSFPFPFPFPGAGPGVFLSSRIRSMHTSIASPPGTR